MESEYQNPRKGTETARFQIVAFLLKCVRVPKSPELNRLLLEKGVCTIGGLKRKCEVIVVLDQLLRSEYQNPRKGTET